MRFSARLAREDVSMFVGVLQSIDRIHEECAVRLSPGAFELNLRSKDEGSGMMAFAKLNACLFTHWRITSARDDEITFMLRHHDVIKALKSADRAEEVSIQLTKRVGVACFTIKVQTIKGIDVTQHVPLGKMLSRDGFRDWAQPKPITMPNLILMTFPNPVHVKMVLERMLRLDKFVTLDVSTRGVMSLKVNTELVCMRTWYRGLDLRRAETGADRTAVTLSAKELLSVVQCSSFLGNNKVEDLLLCTYGGDTLVILLKLAEQGGTINYFVPLVVGDNDDVSGADDDEHIYTGRDDDETEHSDGMDMG